MHKLCKADKEATDAASGEKTISFSNPFLVPLFSIHFLKPAKPAEPGARRGGARSEGSEPAARRGGARRPETGARRKAGAAKRTETGCRGSWSPEPPPRRSTAKAAAKTT